VNNLRIAFWKVERIALLQGRRYGLLVFNPAFDHRRFFECGLRSVKRLLVPSSAGDDCATRFFCCGPIIGISEGVEDGFEGKGDAAKVLYCDWPMKIRPKYSVFECAISLVSICPSVFRA